MESTARSKQRDKFGIGGTLYVRCLVPLEDADKVKFGGLEKARGRIVRRALPQRLKQQGLRRVLRRMGFRVRLERVGPSRDYALLEGQRHNAFVNKGLQNALDLLFGIGGPPAAVSHMGVTNDATAVTAATTLLDPGAADTVVIKALTSEVRTAQTVAAKATFVKADGNIVIRKIGLLNTATDAGTGLINVIGGGGVAPYDETLSLDATGATDWSFEFELQVTAVAT